MLMVDESCFTKAHYEAHTGVAPPHLCELVVHCLELVSHLSSSGLKYRFKGGNSQLILLSEPQRFSIDVDIVTTVEKEELSEIVGRIAEEHPRFTRHEVRPHKTKPWLPILSFKLFFESAYDRPADETFVILDAVLEPPVYGGVTKRVACGELYASEARVELPSVSGLLADKMLCISPATVGIPLGKNKEGHRLKHVFDVANLSRHDPDWDETEEALNNCLAQENTIQKTDHGFEAVCEDTVKFCEAALAHDAPPPVDSLEPGTYLDEIVRGFPEVGSFLFRAEYDWAKFHADLRQVVETFETLRARR